VIVAAILALVAIARNERFAGNIVATMADAAKIVHSGGRLVSRVSDIPTRSNPI
jgi:hypothetical protein